MGSSFRNVVFGHAGSSVLDVTTYFCAALSGPAKGLSGSLFQWLSRSS